MCSEAFITVVYAAELRFLKQLCSWLETRSSAFIWYLLHPIIVRRSLWKSPRKINKISPLSEIHIINGVIFKLFIDLQTFYRFSDSQLQLRCTFLSASNLVWMIKNEAKKPLLWFDLKNQKPKVKWFYSTIIKDFCLIAPLLFHSSVTFLLKIQLKLLGSSSIFSISRNKCHKSWQMKEKIWLPIP